MKTRLLLSICFVLLLIGIPVMGEELTKIYGSIPKNGVNQVTLDNSQNDKEAVVVFKEVNWPVPFAVYIPPNQTGILNLPSESYQVYYSLGYGWNTAEKRFNSEPEYYMKTGVFNAGEEGTVHEEKHAPERVVGEDWDPEEFVASTYGTDIKYAEWKWAESIIPLYLVSGSDESAISVSESEFPL